MLSNKEKQHRQSRKQNSIQFHNLKKMKKKLVFSTRHCAPVSIQFADFYRGSKKKTRAIK